jgi:hypothetical protein
LAEGYGRAVASDVEPAADELDAVRHGRSAQSLQLTSIVGAVYHFESGEVDWLN